MLFVDESAKQDGWEAFPTASMAAADYTTQLVRSHKASPHPPAAPHDHASRAGPSAPRGATLVSRGGAAGFAAALGAALGSLTRLGGGGADAPDTDLPDLAHIMSSERRHSESDLAGHAAADWATPSAPQLYDHGAYGGASVYCGAAAGPSHGPLRAPSGHPAHPHPPHQAIQTSQAMAITPGFAPAASGLAMLPTGGGGGAAVLGLEPPLWLPDSHAADCLSCHLPFRPFTRLRHHCRLCGKIFCAACCHKRALLPPRYGVRCGPRRCPSLFPACRRAKPAARSTLSIATALHAPAALTLPRCCPRAAPAARPSACASCATAPCRRTSSCWRGRWRPRRRRPCRRVRRIRSTLYVPYTAHAHLLAPRALPPPPPAILPHRRSTCSPAHRTAPMPCRCAPGSIRPGPPAWAPTCSKPPTCWPPSSRRAPPSHVITRAPCRCTSLHNPPHAPDPTRRASSRSTGSCVARSVASCPCQLPLPAALVSCPCQLPERRPPLPRRHSHAVSVRGSAAT
jgi:hypothetical protein